MFPLATAKKTYRLHHMCAESNTRRFELPKSKPKSRRSRLKVGYGDTNLGPANGRPR
jgi:hypothetical protein